MDERRPAEADGELAGAWEAAPAVAEPDGGPGRKPVVAVTGAGGFFARALERRLRDQARLRGLFRADDERVRAWSARGHQALIGNLNDERTLAVLADGADVLYHLAARRGKDNLEASRHVNVEATERVARIAADARVHRLVYTSSISVYAETAAPGGVITEEVEPERVERLNPYSRTKYEGERVLWRLAEEGRAPPITIVRPTNVYGPWGRAWFLDWVRRLQKVPVVIGGNAVIDLVHVDDVADGLVRAAAAPQAAGTTLHFGHHAVELGEFAALLGAAVGIRVRHLPAPLDAAARAALEYGHRLVRGTRRSTPLLGRRAYPHERARRLIGYAPRIPLEEGLTAAGRWYREVCLSGGNERAP